MDIETRRKKQQDLMRQMVERKVRSRAQELYESRGKAEGQDLQDWFQAESEVIDNIGHIYRRLRNSSDKTAALRETANPDGCEANL